MSYAFYKIKFVIIFLNLWVSMGGITVRGFFPISPLMREVSVRTAALPRKKKQNAVAGAAKDICYCTEI